MMKEWVHAAVWTKRHRGGQLGVAELAHVRRFFGEADNFVDVGAHAGSWSFPVSRWIPRGKVYAFEALPYYASVLRKLFTLNGRSNVEVINAAVTSGPCTLRLAWRDTHGKSITGFTHIATKEEPQETTVEVKGMALDDYFAGTGTKIRFLKCDVEGAEMGVFKGARKLLAESRPFVFSELVPGFLARYGNSVPEVLGFFGELGFKPYELGADGRFSPVGGGAAVPHDVFFAPGEWKP